MNTKSLVMAILFLTSGFLYYSLTSNPTNEETNIDYSIRFPINIETRQVTRVVDGDTIELKDGTKVRLIGINTPEKNMPFYNEAKEFLENKVLNKTIRLENYGVDRYKRTLGHIFINDENINNKILSMGLGNLFYYERDEYYNNLKDSEEKARLNQIGIWKKSPKSNCLELIELKYKESPKRCTNNELLIIKNNCNEDIQIIIKDEATHTYKEEIKANDVFTKNFSCIWNNAGDSLYVSNQEGLLIYYSY